MNCSFCANAPSMPNAAMTATSKILPSLMFSSRFWAAQTMPAAEAAQSSVSMRERPRRRLGKAGSDVLLREVPSARTQGGCHDADDRAAQDDERNGIAGSG